MSLDDLITLLLVLLFVGAPLLRRFMGQSGGRPGEGRPEEAEGRGEPAGRASEERSQPATERGGATRGETFASTTAREVERPSTELERKLAEARRRVQEAREGAPDRGAKQGGRGRRPPAPDRRVWDEPPKPLVQPRAENTSGFLGREGTREPRAKTAPLKVSKLGRKHRGSRLSSAHGVMSVRPHDILQGIVWHQILSEPVSKRPRRRKPSRVR